MGTKALALLGVLVAVGTTRASDWSRWRGPDGTGISSEKDWRPQSLASGKVKWKTNLGLGHSSVCIAGKTLYTMGNVGEKDIVYALDAETGKEQWRFSYACSSGNYAGTRAMPVLDGEFLYTLSREGEAYCLEARTGHVKWQTHLARQHGSATTTWGFSGSPVISGTMVLYNARAAGIALDKLTGQKIWASGGGAPGFASPVLFRHKGTDCVAIFGSQEVVVADVATGKKLYSHPWKTEYDVNAADPVYIDGKLFIASGYERGCALLDLSGNSVRESWENKNLRAHFASPIYFEGHLYGVDGNTGTGQLKCLDAKSGQVKWQQNGGFENLMLAGGHLLVIDKKGVLSVWEASAARGREVAKVTVLNGKAKNWTAPVLANGFIYCRNGDGELVCLDAR